MVDDYIRVKHPEMDLEKAQTLQEIEQRHQCVVHYGTWAPQGHTNPDNVGLTPDTRVNRGLPRWSQHNFPEEAFPIFRENILGIGSEVARFIFETIDPVECALNETRRMNLSAPNLSTLTVLGLNSFTGRHRDQTDIKHGLASLVAMGQYDGDLCFPSSEMKLSYQPGDCVVFRGAEEEHFVRDWRGYRFFLLFTNHQPVLPVVPPEVDIEAHDPCFNEISDQEEEELSEKDMLGPALDESESSLSLSSED
ncbi:Uu.00g083070.m01.CDS01 [Anthostomella pinea]|uniref:Uu.00g083070.m01.CDS01 n=1 Tax=Anthostomella pinea TaxID=933095 RepID=A0AAI8VMF2_9PEZI|nr:Uu.00g083070.m01.CDS01 [Anthostomella pinea]